MRKNTSKFSSRSPTVEVTGLWDFENAWIPDDFKLQDLKGCIEDALQKSNPAYVIRNKIIAVGPGTGDRARAIRNCHRDFKLKAIPKANLRCDYQGCGELVVRRDGYEHEQLMRKTDTADKFIIKKLFLKVLDHRKNFLVITGDVDFSASLATLKNHNINVMLALHENSRLELFDSAAATWIWRSNEDRDVDTMLKKGRPITRNRLRNRAR